MLEFKKEFIQNFIEGNTKPLVNLLKSYTGVNVEVVDTKEAPNAVIVDTNIALNPDSLDKEIIRLEAAVKKNKPIKAKALEETLRKFETLNIDLDRKLISATNRDFKLVIKTDMSYFTKFEESGKAFETMFKTAYMETLRFLLETKEMATKLLAIDFSTKTKDELITSFNDVFDLKLSVDDSMLDMTNKILSKFQGPLDNVNNGFIPIVMIILPFIMIVFAFFYLAFVFVAIISVIRLIATIFVMIFKLVFANKYSKSFYKKIKSVMAKIIAYIKTVVSLESGSDYDTTNVLLLNEIKNDLGLESNTNFNYYK